MFPIAPTITELPTDYFDWLADLKQRIQHERFRVILVSNAAMVLLYWDIGERILEKQNAQGWGAKTIDRLALDLHKLFPDMKGFSPRNLKYMRAFASAWPERKIVQTALAQLTWYHNITLLEKLKIPEERLFMALTILPENSNTAFAAPDFFSHMNQKIGIKIKLIKIIVSVISLSMLFSVDSYANRIGNLSNNPYAPNSSSRMGNEYDSNSVNNKYGRYGSPYSNESANNPYATNAPKLYDSQGNYHGKLSANPYDPDSTSNPYGKYGSPYSSESINNPYGAGSAYNSDSPNNSHGNGMAIVGN
jgi:Protein of unknown function (DUF1016).